MRLMITLALTTLLAPLAVAQDPTPPTRPTSPTPPMGRFGMTAFGSSDTSHREAANSIPDQPIRADPFAGKTVTAQYESEQLSAVLQQILGDAGISYVADSNELRNQVTINLQNVPLREALETLLSISGLGHSVSDSGLVTVGDARSIGRNRDRDDRTFQQMFLPMMREEEAVAFLQSRLSPDGEIRSFSMSPSGPHAQIQDHAEHISVLRGDLNRLIENRMREQTDQMLVLKQEIEQTLQPALERAVAEAQMARLAEAGNAREAEIEAIVERAVEEIERHVEERLEHQEQMLIERERREIRELDRAERVQQHQDQLREVIEERRNNLEGAPEALRSREEELREYEQLLQEAIEQQQRDGDGLGAAFDQRGHFGPNVEAQGHSSEESQRGRLNAFADQQGLPLMVDEQQPTEEETVSAMDNSENPLAGIALREVLVHSEIPRGLLNDWWCDSRGREDAVIRAIHANAASGALGD